MIRPLANGICRGEITPLQRHSIGQVMNVRKDGPNKIAKYTEMNSKFGNLTRKRPEFEQAKPQALQLNLNRLGDAGGI